MNYKKEYLNRYVKIVDFLAEILGPAYEVVLHDLTNLENSIIAIRNNQISGREIGAPATDLVLKIMKDSELQKKDFFCNYKSYTKNGKQFRSSTFFIRDDSQKIIGMLCINSDLEMLHKLVDAVQCIVEYNHLNSIELNDFSVSENLSSSIEDLTSNSIETTISSSGVVPERMTQEEKIKIVEDLNSKGVFLLKGAVSEVAAQLKTSEATIYRYLQKVK